MIGAEQWTMGARVMHRDDFVFPVDSSYKLFTLRQCSCHLTFSLQSSADLFMPNDANILVRAAGVSHFKEPTL